MIKILLDTSIIVDYLRRKDKDKGVLDKFTTLGSKYELFISIITHTECYAGKSIWESKDAKKALEFLLSGFNILSLDEKVSEKTGEIKARYNVSIPDAIIAATALYHNMEIATLNIKDFKKIEGNKLVKMKKSTDI